MGVVSAAEKPPLGEKNRIRRMRRRKSVVTPYRVGEKWLPLRQTASGPHVDYNARLYDPALGRFLSTDPLIAHPGSTQSINPYSYVENNPLNKTDPTGMMDCADNQSLCNTSTKDVQSVSVNQKTGQVTVTKTDGSTMKSGFGAMSSHEAVGFAAGAAVLKLHTIAKNAAGGDASKVSKHDFKGHSLTMNAWANGRKVASAKVPLGNAVAYNQSQVGKMGKGPYAVTPFEESLASIGALGAFWETRMFQGDPVGPVGVAEWGDADAQSFIRSDLVMSAGISKRILQAGLLLAGHIPSGSLMHQIGQQLVEAHIYATRRDWQNRAGLVPGELSASQVFDYHKPVFGRYGVSMSYFGGTLLGGNKRELQEMSGYWCGGCDPLPR